jgi:predicted MFS family arabinose efflux permease
MTATHQQHRLSTRLAFLVAGIAMSAWAPLVPYAKERAGLDASQLGLLLLCLGIGSLSAMPVTGAMTTRFGCKPIVFLSGLAVCLILPLLAWVTSPLLLAATLLVFGAAMGTLDVSMNVQAVIVEKHSGQTIMSGFHGLFSVGGIVGAGGMALLLSSGLAPLPAAVLVALVCTLLIMAARPYLLAETEPGEGGALFVRPRGAVVLIGLLCCVSFLAEGAVLDWSALLLTGSGLSAHLGGLGYAVFAVAMTVGRLTGDRVVRRFGGKRVLVAGSLCTAAGFLVAVLAPSPAVALAGFVLVGIGASNIVPVLFRAAGKQDDMAPGLAISAVTTAGYAGILAGPALIGFVAEAISLQLAFAVLGASMLLIALSAPRFGRLLAA